MTQLHRSYAVYRGNVYAQMTAATHEKANMHTVVIEMSPREQGKVLHHIKLKQSVNWLELPELVAGLMGWCEDVRDRHGGAGGIQSRLHWQTRDTDAVCQLWMSDRERHLSIFLNREDRVYWQGLALGQLARNQGVNPQTALSLLAHEYRTR
ncbi:MAG: hypothetical protein C9356_15085 [Oleiphilus sp.]|nr:MAG: hypothetical protein C9356_15085 [Oleiphilus sp.]